MGDYECNNPAAHIDPSTDMPSHSIIVRNKRVCALCHVVTSRDFEDDDLFDKEGIKPLHVED